VLRRPRRITPYTVVDPARLAAQLVEVRRTGAAWTREEMAMGASSIAVGVTGAGDCVVAAVGVVVASTRPNIWVGLPALRAAASAIGASIRAGQSTAAA